MEIVPNFSNPNKLKSREKFQLKNQFNPLNLYLKYLETILLHNNKEFLLAIPLQYKNNFYSCLAKKKIGEQCLLRKFLLICCINNPRDKKGLQQSNSIRTQSSSILYYQET